MASIKGSKTEINLLTSFAGESQARMRYTFFSSAARKEGFISIAKLFLETAEQEKEHAKRMFTFLEGGMVEIKAAYPAGGIGQTLDNLQAAAAGEHEEWSLLYPGFAQVARAEGFVDVATMYEKIAIAEQYHEKRYRALAANIAAGRVCVRPTAVTWYCTNCGYIHEGTSAPKRCPACLHPVDYFELLAEPF
jgi:rubrerythrin